MTLHLSTDQLKIIKNILTEHSLLGYTYAFGSRTRGDHRKYSDLDLLVKQESPLSIEQVVALKDSFENSNLTITVDVVDFHKIDEEFKRSISSELVKI